MSAWAEGKGAMTQDLLGQVLSTSHRALRREQGTETPKLCWSLHSLVRTQFPHQRWGNVGSNKVLITWGTKRYQEVYVWAQGRSWAPQTICTEMCMYAPTSGRKGAWLLASQWGPGLTKVEKSLSGIIFTLCSKSDGFWGLRFEECDSITQLSHSPCEVPG